MVFLENIDTPEDLRKLSKSQLRQLADELRQFLLDSVSQTGGHLSSNLGTVELTIALHYVFDTPRDRLVWDVGHQTYGHKILTGRRQGMSRLRMKEGISGFPRREESEYDTFGVGHSSTSISAALGMAIAARQKEEDRRVVAIIGDGAMSAGQAFEALNNAGASDVNLLVILNDNEMSISRPVGAMGRYLAGILTGGTFNRARRVGEKALSATPTLLNFARRAEEHVKGMFVPGTLFEELGFKYYGPLDGHDLDILVSTLDNLRKLPGLRFLHVVTKKGQGYKLAENNPVLYHGVSSFDADNGIQPGSGGKLTYTQVFGQWLCHMALADERLIGITPAMCEGSGLQSFAQQFPQRYFDVGIAEQHALTFAAGLACEGLKPVVAIYSTFLQRAYDQLIHDIALQNLDVTLAIDRGGLVGADGATHNGAFDLSYLTCIPNMVVMTPADEAQCHDMLTTAFHYPGPAAVRYPRGVGAGVEPGATIQPSGEYDIGRAQLRRQGRQVALLVFGAPLQAALEAGGILDASVADMRFAKPLDKDMLSSLAEQHDELVSIEENSVIGGAGAEVERVLTELNIEIPLLRIGLPDRFIDHGDQGWQLDQVGLSAPAIVRQIKSWQEKAAKRTKMSIRQTKEAAPA